MKALDSIDKGILALLQQDAKMTHKEIAAQLGLTTTPVYERVKRLEREGYIRAYVALLDAKKAGRNLTVFCSVSLARHAFGKLEDFVESIRAIPEVLEMYHVTGAYDYLLKVLVADMDEYEHFLVRKLSTIENIAHVQSSFVLTEIKHHTALPL